MQKVQEVSTREMETLSFLFSHFSQEELFSGSHFDSVSKAGSVYDLTARHCDSFRY